MALDVVCGMEVDEATAEWTAEYQSTTYYFCAPGCMAAFEKDPEKYLAAPGKHGMGHHDHGMHD